MGKFENLNRKIRDFWKKINVAARKVIFRRFPWRSKSGHLAIEKIDVAARKVIFRSFPRGRSKSGHLAIEKIDVAARKAIFRGSPGFQRRSKIRTSGYWKNRRSGAKGNFPKFRRSKSGHLAIEKIDGVVRKAIFRSLGLRFRFPQKRLKIRASGYWKNRRSGTKGNFPIPSPRRSKNRTSGYWKNRRSATERGFLEGWWFPRKRAEMWAFGH